MSAPISSEPDARVGPNGPAERRGPLLFWVAAALGVLLVAGGAWEAYRSLAAGGGATAATGKPAADFQVPDIQGNEVRLSDLRGQVVLLDFWTTWCPTCRSEMPDLNALYQEYGAEHDFVVVGVNLEETHEAVSSFAKEHAITFPMLRDADGRVSTIRYGIRSLPTSVIVDREGKVRDQWTGQLSKARILERLARVW